MIFITKMYSLLEIGEVLAVGRSDNTVSFIHDRDNEVYVVVQVSGGCVRVIAMEGQDTHAGKLRACLYTAAHTYGPRLTMPLEFARPYMAHNGFVNFHRPGEVGMCPAYMSAQHSALVGHTAYHTLSGATLIQVNVVMSLLQVSHFKEMVAYDIVGAGPLHVLTVEDDHIYLVSCMSMPEYADASPPDTRSAFEYAVGIDIRDKIVRWQDVSVLVVPHRTGLSVIVTTAQGRPEPILIPWDTIQGGVSVTTHVKAPHTQGLMHVTCHNMSAQLATITKGQDIFETMPLTLRDRDVSLDSDTTDSEFDTNSEADDIGPPVAQSTVL
ncbi:hypothetical protein [Red seabream iridovirus]|uniref:ORF014R n=5 Tax=Infectious spleen and kidney necrosis virus TaxID=180170 RepID=Q5YF73_ISKNV|nr:ORF014R [Rock bream iridovirus]AAX82325.1 ORF16R [Orange-spotted grouper iridovirus]AMM72662.1 ORF016R [giant sea perch iridovirus - K1]QQA04010.1 hypothetical protein Geno-4000015 [Large yellow croaker iridovirus]UNA01223.1 hypothetical protein [Red seabream iridovirus]WBR81492.1 hypothetical protein ORF016R [Spotted knifejaw iridovirus]